MYGNIGLLWQGPVEMGRHRAFLARRHAGDAQTAGPGRGCGVCGGDKGSVTSPQDETSADVRTVRQGFTQTWLGIIIWRF